MDKKTLKACQQRIGYSFKNDFWLTKALTHSSNKGNGSPCNERLEFLGDAVLGMVISKYLFSNFKEHSEGELTRTKSIVVSRATLAKRGEALGLERLASVGKGMLDSAGLPASVVANVMEAIIGAIFVDGGIEPAARYILQVLSPDIQEAVENHHRTNFKSLLQQFAQREFASTPTYRVIGDSGPDHEKVFHVATVISGRQFQTGWGRSKKEAEQRAAELTYSSLMHSGIGAPPETGEL